MRGDEGRPDAAHGRSRRVRVEPRGTARVRRVPDDPSRGVPGTARASCARISIMRLRIFTEPQQGADYETLFRVAQATERLGFDGFFRSDHYLSMGAGSGLPGPSDAWVTLAALATATERIRPSLTAIPTRIDTIDFATERDVHSV